MESLWNLIVVELKNNQLVQGGFVIGIGATLLTYLKLAPRWFYNQYLQHLTIKVEFDKQDPLFQWFVEWLNSQSFLHQKTRLRITTKVTADDVSAVYSLASGSYLVKYENLRMIVSRVKTKNEGGDQSPGNLAEMMAMEKFTIRVFRWNRNKLKKMIANVHQQFSKKNEGKISVYQYMWNSWRLTNSQPKRGLSNVVLKEGQKETLMKDIETFANSEDWYIQQGIPYQRGYLLSGPPGTGKTSLIFSVASHLGYKLCPIKLSNFNDKTLEEAFISLPENALTVIEDIDSFFVGRESIMKSKEILTFSGLLNAINGLVITHGRILFITTNHIEKLDPALIRAGRIDKKYILDYVDYYQAKHLFLNFFPKESEASATFGHQCELKDISPSEIQEYLTLHRNSSEEVLENIEEELLKKHSYKEFEFTEQVKQREIHLAV